MGIQFVFPIELIYFRKSHNKSTIITLSSMDRQPKRQLKYYFGKKEVDFTIFHY